MKIHAYVGVGTTHGSIELIDQASPYLTFVDEKTFKYHSEIKGWTVHDVCSGKS